MAQSSPPKVPHPRIDHFCSNLRRRTPGLEVEQEIVVGVDEVLKAYLKANPEDADFRDYIENFIRKKAWKGKLSVFKVRWDEAHT